MFLGAPGAGVEAGAGVEFGVVDDDSVLLQAKPAENSAAKAIRNTAIEFGLFTKNSSW
jgi:hypothetical protein